MFEDVDSQDTFADEATSIGELLHILNGHGVTVTDYELVEKRAREQFDIGLDSTLAYAAEEEE